MIGENDDLGVFFYPSRCRWRDNARDGEKKEERMGRVLLVRERERKEERKEKSRPKSKEVSTSI